MYYYDINGWLSSEPIEGRSTIVEPMPAEGNMVPNFTGHVWVLMEKTDAPEMPMPTEQEKILQRLNEIEKEIFELRTLIQQ
ncbi:hypothetical protein EBT25_09025 [bacterium]|jgi:hypothetical protein|nr:hypothetical protein [bacterium]